MSGSNPLPAGQAVIIPQLGAGNLAAGNTSLNGGFGGQAASNSRPLRSAPQFTTRQPYLGHTPAVLQCVGFGSGSGASVANSGSDADWSQGLVRIKVGLNPMTTVATIAIQFPASVNVVSGQYVTAADWANVAENIVSNALYATCTLTRRLIPGEVLLLAYQWRVSQ